MERQDSPRETLTEYEENGTTVAVIRDPENEEAWIESTVCWPIQQ